MSHVRPTEARTLRDVFAPMLALLAKLVEQMREGHRGNEELEDLRALLERLPLTTEEFGLATTRMGNAHRYVKAREQGAARWELKALRGQLQRQLQLQTAGYAPRRRGFGVRS